MNRTFPVIVGASPALAASMWLAQSQKLIQMQKFETCPHNQTPATKD